MKGSFKTPGGLNLGNLPADPAFAARGDQYYNTTWDLIRFYNGTEWRNIGGPGFTYLGGTPSGGLSTGGFSIMTFTGGGFILDPNSLYVSGTATIVVPGYYSFSAQVSVTGTIVVNVEELTLSIFVNGSRRSGSVVAWGSANAASTGTGAGTSVNFLKLKAGDAVTVQGIGGAGTSWSHQNSSSNMFSGACVG